jgi:tetratricopeptide (TPR) repeat protein
LDQASAARRSGDLAGAASFYKKVIGVNSDNASALAGLGAIARLQGNYPEAKGYFDQVMSRSPNNLAALVGGADVRWLMGAKEGAVVLYRKIPSGTAFYSHAQRRIAEFSGGSVADEGGSQPEPSGETKKPSVAEPGDPKPDESEAADRPGTQDEAQAKVEAPAKLVEPDEAPAKPLPAPTPAADEDDE